MMIKRVVLFSVFALATVNVNIVGAVKAGEIVLILAAPYVILPSMRDISVGTARVVLGMLAVYFVAQVVSDAYRETMPEDYLRGSARIVVAMLAYVFCCCALRKDTKALNFVFLGSICSMLVGPWLATRESLATTADNYKFFIGPGISLLSFWLVDVTSKRTLGGVVRFAPVLAGIAALLFNSRSLAGITLLAAGFEVLVGPHGAERRIEWHALLRRVAVLLTCGFAIVWLYTFAVSRGMLGDTALEKYEMQTGGQQFTLLSARNEVLFAAPKIAESPLIGWGSWPKDRAFVTARAEELGMSRERAIYVGSLDDGLIPTHSHILTAWVEAGIFGAMFWIVLFVYGGYVLIRREGRIAALFPNTMVYVLITFLWDICFSPFGGERRVWDGFCIFIITSSYDEVAFKARASVERALNRLPSSRPRIRPTF